jgi:release factor glutamine methyltransferase
MTARQALAEGSAALARAGVDSPALDASLFLADILNVSRAALIAAGPEPLDDRTLVRFWERIRRRTAGECAAYILGRKEFYGLEFTVGPAVLVPRPDTETLVEAALEFCRGTPRGAAGFAHHAVLDLCTGSGAVAIALKHELPGLEMWAADMSAGALALARTNAGRLLPPEAIRFRQGDLFDALDGGGPFSLIVSNPPYIPTGGIFDLPPEVRNEPILALDGGGDGLVIIKKIIDRSPDFLRPGGRLLLEADPGQMRIISGLLEQKGFLNIQTYRDLSGGERVSGGDMPRPGA